MNSSAELKVDGMTCPACVRGVTKKLSAVKGVSAAAVDLATGKATVQHDSSLSSVEDLIAAVEQLGYQAARS